MECYRRKFVKSQLSENTAEGGCYNPPSSQSLVSRVLSHNLQCWKLNAESEGGRKKKIRGLLNISPFYFYSSGKL